MNNYDFKCFITERIGIVQKLISKMEFYQKERIEPNLNEVLWMKDNNNFLSGYMLSNSIITAVENDLERLEALSSIL